MKGKKYILAALLLCTIGTSHLFSQICDCVTTGNCPVQIEDNGSFQGTLDVTVSGANDLGQCPLTSVCFSITHTWVGDLAVTLTSPSGVNYMVMADANNGTGGCGTDSDNIDICIVPGTGNPVTNNTEYLCNTGACQSGTCCLVGAWTMPCGGVTDPITGAAQAPNCDLNDFNVPGQPANGTWTLTVNDVCSQDVGTLNNFSLTFACGVSSCTVCSANGGTITNPDLEACLGDPSLNLNITPVYTGGNQMPNPAEYDYSWVISLNGVIQQVNPTPDMSSLPPGVYTLCGFSYDFVSSSLLSTLIGQNLSNAINQFNSGAAPFCGDFSDDCMVVTIGPAISPTFIDTMLCIGECIEVGFQPVCASGSFTLTSYLGCDSMVNVTITNIPPITTIQNVTVCQGDCITVNGQDYCPPVATYSVPNWQGCDSTITLIFNEVITQAFINPPFPDPLSCSNPAVTLDALSSVPSNAMILWAGPNGFSSTQPLITTSIPGTYTLTVTNNALNPPCISEASVDITGNSDFPNLQLNNAPPSICEGESFDLSSLNIIDLNGTNPVLTYHSGTPATPANELFDTNVSPNTTTTYYVLGTTGICFDELPVTLTVNPAPTASFTVISPICSNGSTTVTFTGSAPPGATFTWNFGGGTAVPGIGPGPHTVTWGLGGTKTITLQITAAGCQSGTATETVEVDSPIPPPSINCNSTSSEITFYWDPIPGAIDYTVTVISGPTGTQLDPTTYFVDNLMPGEQATISVTAISGNACPNSTAQLSCSAEDCPPVVVTINAIPDVCLTPFTDSIQLVASQTGGMGGGTYTWSGPGVNPASGYFIPANANPGANTISVSYAEGTCTYNKSIVVNVFPTPTANFTATTPICSSDFSTVNYTGNASSSATFNWDFNGGTATPATGPGPLQVTWPSAGTYTVSLMVMEGGCESGTSTQTVDVSDEIAAPQVTCNSTTNSVEFVWNNIPGANGYTVNVVSGGTGTATSDTSMLFTGLNPGDAVTVEVVALDPGPCGNMSTQATCIAQDCPAVTINITPVPPICLSANAMPVTLEATQTGGMGGGTFDWTGPGVSPTGVFDPLQANVGANTVTATYTEGDCVFTKTLVINVLAQPVASFSAPDSVCTNAPATVSYTGTTSPGLQFTWDFDGGNATPGTGQGPHQVNWTTAGPHIVSLTVTTSQGCVSLPYTDTIQVDQPLIAPAITCVTTTNSIEFTWPNVTGATDYQVTLVSGPTGSQTSQNAYFIDGLQPGDQATISLSVSNGGPCPPVTVQQTCIAQDCDPVTIDIATVADICLDASTTPITLQATTTGGLGTGTLTWNGTAVSLDGIFDPQQASAGANTITAVYTEGDCIYTQDIVINVYPQPVASFTAAAAACEGEDITVTFNGTAQTGLSYEWDFGTGTATSGTGAGPHQVNWANAGSEQITLTVTSAQGCKSELFSSTVQVESPLIAPVINCNTTLSTIEFNWPDVTGATDYQVTLISGTPGSQTSPNSYEITGLNPGDQATIELTVSNGGPCPPVTVQETCTAQDCLPVVVSVDPVTPICLGSVASIQLTATVTGNAGGGTETWSGPGTSASGVFDPATAGVGTHQVVVVYEENNCTYQAAGTVQVLPTPTADFNASAVICETDGATVTYAGTASASATYAWDFGGGTATPGTGQGPHQVSFPTPGNYNITLTVTQAGCTSSQITHSVQVDPALTLPDIDCTTNTSSIEFTWNTVPNATDYQVVVLAGQTGNQTSPTSYLVDGLQPNDEVTIELTVSGNTACPPVTVQQTCIAQECPPLTIDLVPVDPICLVAGASTIQLTANVTGGSGAGTATWSGPGVSASGVFNPSTAGVGNHTIMYVYNENANCSYDATQQIQVVAAPVADAGADGVLTCEVGGTSIQLGGSGTSTGPNISYLWTAANGNFPGTPDIPNPVVAAQGTYTLTVTNTELAGCSATDVVVVSASQDLPAIKLNIVPVSCFGENDGAISVDSVSGGQPPYLYSLNGGAYAAASTFQPLAPGVYQVSVIDASGCEASLTIDITQPQELNVELVAVIEGGGNIIRLGDTTELQALVSLPSDSLDNINWFPKELVSCDTCLNTFVSPTDQTTYSITVESNGCVDSDELTLFVKKDRPVYVPNAFSPNEDGLNDIFMVYAGKQVTKVKSFLVFDRWGETVYQHYNFQPNDPTYGWDGKLRGDFLNTAVFTWFAEIEFVDGKVELYEGDVTLFR